MIIVFDTYHLMALVGFTALLGYLWVISTAPWPFKFTWLYFLGYSFALGFWQTMNTMSVSTIVIKLMAMKMFAILFLFWAFIINLDIRHLVYIMRFIYLVLVLDGAWVTFGEGESLFIGNTMDTTIFAIALPLLFADKYFRWFIPGFFYTIFIIGGITSYAILFGYLAILMGVLFKKWWQQQGALVLLGLIALYAYTHQSRTHERWRVVWKEHMVYWYEHSNRWFGFGPGSFEFISAVIKEHVESNKYWLHSDWLQILFETGIVGLAIAIPFYLFVLWTLRSHLISFMVWAGLGIGMLTYSPLQVFVGQLFCAIILWKAYLISAGDSRTRQLAFWE